MRPLDRLRSSYRIQSNLPILGPYESFFFQKGSKMLPFLKDRHEGSASGPVEVIERKPDEGEDFEMLDAIVEDMMEAMASKNKKLLKGALEALCEHIQSQDEIQDQEPVE